MKIELLNKDKFIDVERNESLYSILKKEFGDDYIIYLGAKVNIKVQSLDFAELNENDKVRFFDIKDRDGRRIYIRTLSLIYIKACKDIFNDIDVEIKHSLNKGLYTELKNKQLISKNQLISIKNRMNEIIEAKRPITSV